MLYTKRDNEGPILSFQSALAELTLRLDSQAVNEVNSALENHYVDKTRIDRDLDEAAPFLAEQHRLWRAILEVSESYFEGLMSELVRFREFSATYFGQLEGRAREEVLLERLEQEADTRLEFILDRRSVRSGYLDFETYQERHLKREAHCVSQVRVCLFALEGLGEDMLARLNHDSSVTVASDLLVLSDSLFGLAQSTQHPDLAWLALRAASPLLTSLVSRSSTSPLPSEWLTLCIQTILSTRRSTWMRRSALEIIARDPNSGLEMLQAQLTRRDGESWHVASHAASLIAAHHPESAVEVLGCIDEVESDAVLMSISRACGELSKVGSIDLLTKLSEPDRPLKVRNAAAESLARLTGGGGETAALAAGRLAELLLDESEAAVVETLCRTLRQALETRLDDDEAANAALQLRKTLARRLEIEVDPAISGHVAAFRLDLAEIVETSRAGEAATSLQDALHDLQFGQQIRIHHENEKSQLARAMALAARHGFGLYATKTRKGWKVRRGERFRTRLWRVIHEIRHPAPNKRQGFRHTRARTFDGPLRAHPEALGEVTPTTVPGERRMVQSEGGWGPYLPLVDDILDAQSSASPVELVTTAGITRVLAPDSRLERFKNHIALSWSYAELDETRLASMTGKDASERARFLEEIRLRYQTRVVFEPHYKDDPAPNSVRSLVARGHDQPLLESPRNAPQLPGPESPVILGATTFNERIAEIVTWGSDNATRLGVELFERGGVRIRDLAVVIVIYLSLFLTRMLWVRMTFDRWRDEIPLCIGGWGTRGKSGTERLKAAVFHGLGHEVFVKTTGCEAMFIHAPRRQDAREIFVYRPYDKASIWEQRDLLELGKNLNTDVFLWECMALNPRYVDILQRHWMRDDLVTLTNAYPDHEDIQGPSGIDVAETIAQFIPTRGIAITSEREMLPIFERAARDRGTQLHVVDHAQELSIPDDIIRRMPYEEHPRNIALVARMATELGIDREFALFAMADYVVPDLGVLKVYPEVRILGRDLYFINGCSANERAGFMANWTRLELGQITPDRDPERHVVTVVNNRGDRISRSVVFADILVRDVAVDRHVLIGTNLSGLRNYFSDSLDRFLSNITIAQPDGDHSTATARLVRFLARVRLVDASPEWLLQRLRTMAQGCALHYNSHPEDTKTVENIVTRIADRRLDWDATLDALADDEDLAALLERIEDSEDALPAPADLPVDITDITTASRDELKPFFVERLACVALARALREELLSAIETDAIDPFTERACAVWRQRFWSTVVSLEDPDISGDGIIVRCAENVPPGFKAALLGTQNIKGTGLDFVYRWVNLDSTLKRLESLRDADESVFQNELLWLSAAKNIKLTEVVRALDLIRELERTRNSSPREATLIDRTKSHLAQRVRTLFEETTHKGNQDTNSLKANWLARAEKILDPFDALWRRYRSEHLMRMLTAQRISHARMADEMQKLTKRQKGGWLAEVLTRGR